MGLSIVGTFSAIFLTWWLRCGKGAGLQIGSDIGINNVHKSIILTKECIIGEFTAVAKSLEFLLENSSWWS